MLLPKHPQQSQPTGHVRISAFSLRKPRGLLPRYNHPLLPQQPSLTFSPLSSTFFSLSLISLPPPHSPSCFAFSCLSCFSWFTPPVFFPLSPSSHPCPSVYQSSPRPSSNLLRVLRVFAVKPSPRLPSSSVLSVYSVVHFPRPLSPRSSPHGIHHTATAINPIVPTTAVTIPETRFLFR